MNLLTPRTYRVKPAQDAWLQEVASKEGHGNKALTLRMLLDREMARNEKSLGSRTRKTPSRKSN